MKYKNHIERKKARTKISRKLISKGEVSTNKSNKQVDNQATTNQTLSPENNTKNPDSKKSYFTKIENSGSDLFILNSDIPNASTEEPSFSNETEQTALQEQSEQIESQKQNSDSTDEFIEDIPSVYFLRAKTLFECKDSQARKIAIKTIKDVNHNTKSGWLLIGIAAYRVLHKTVSLPGGSRKKDDLKIGRVSAMKKFALECADQGAEIDPSTLYAYTRWVKVLLEEPLAKFAGDEKTLRRQRIVLMEKLFTFPPTIAKTLSTGSRNSEKLEIACKLEEELGRVATHSELKKALRNYFKNKSGGSSEGGGSGYVNETGELNRDLDPKETSQYPEEALPPRPAQKFEASSKVSGLFDQQIHSEAERVKVEPEKVKDLYVSFLQMILSIVQNMEVKK